jgi:hypothetical protein
MLEGRVTRQLVVSLLNHIRAFSDWAQCFVLELVARYQPASEEERFDILEVRTACCMLGSLHIPVHEIRLAV